MVLKCFVSKIISDKSLLNKLFQPKNDSEISPVCFLTILSVKINDTINCSTFFQREINALKEQVENLRNAVVDNTAAHMGKS